MTASVVVRVVKRQFTDEAAKRRARAGLPRAANTRHGHVMSNGHDMDTLTGNAPPGHRPVAAVLVHGLPDVGTQLPDQGDERHGRMVEFGSLTGRPERRTRLVVCTHQPRNNHSSTHMM